MMEVTIDIWQTDEMPLLTEFLAKLETHRNTLPDIKYHNEPELVRTAIAEDIPAQPIEKVLEEIHSQQDVPTVSIVPVSNDEIVKIVNAAQARGFGIDKIKAVLKEFGVSRVADLTAEQKAEFAAVVQAANQPT